MEMVTMDQSLGNLLFQPKIQLEKCLHAFSNTYAVPCIPAFSFPPRTY